jgi:hypothetical protein
VREIWPCWVGLRISVGRGSRRVMGEGRVREG